RLLAECPPVCIHGNFMDITQTIGCRLDIHSLNNGSRSCPIKRFYGLLKRKCLTVTN
ncbi:hypothetical protein K1T71_006342, partial [Dendrolimus kikuchii]